MFWYFFWPSRVFFLPRYLLNVVYRQESSTLKSPEYLKAMEQVYADHCRAFMHSLAVIWSVPLQDVERLQGIEL